MKHPGRAVAQPFLTALALSVAVLAVCAAFVTSSMRNRFDRQLEAAATRAAGHLEGNGAAHVQSDAIGTVLIAVHDSEGNVTGPIPQSAYAELAEIRRSGVRFARVRSTALESLLGPGPVRVVTHAAAAGRSVQPAASEAPARADRRSVWLGFLLPAPLLAGLVALGARSKPPQDLSRLDEIARLASELTPSQLNRRIEERGDTGDVGRLVTAMNTLLARMDACFVAQDRFISEVSHELKTPVSVLLLEAQVLERSEPDPLVYAKFVASVEDEMRRLAQLVESFLTLARAKHGETQVRRVTVDINDTTVEAGQHCWAYARMRELVLSMNLVPEEDCPGAPMVSGDPDLLRTMIENLLRNAIAVSPRQSQVDLTVACDDQAVTVSVRDRGPGVPESLASRIFERFVTADHARQGTKGSGLGLAIAKGIAELHSGRIQFRNLSPSEGGGAEFAARIPLLNRPTPSPGKHG